MADYYEILGVSQKASQSEIRSAYRRLARKYHPDVSRSPEADQNFSRISEAYRILSNPQLRALYDEGGEDSLAGHKRLQDIRRQQAAYKTRINNLVDEMIAEDRLEATARGQAVTVVVTLYASNFIVALAKPAILAAAGLFWKTIAAGLFVFGIRYLYQSIGKIIERYTYIPDFPSVTRMAEPPKQPFSRRTALVFLACGYGVSLTLGTIFGYWVDDGCCGPYFDNWYLLNILLLPPIAVFIIHMWRMLVSKLDEVFDL